MRLKMTTRIFSITTYTLVVILAAIYLHLGGVQKDTKYDKKNIFSYNNGVEPNIAAYVKLIEELRDRLTGGTSHEIAVTRPRTDILPKERFIQVQLENSRGEVITIIIDTEDAYVVGYLVGSTLRPTLHYLDGNARDALLQAFPSPQYIHSGLGFDGNYRNLGNREKTKLGHGALNDAIKNLFQGNSHRSALLVIIQMVSEAVRIRYIEHLIRRNMLGDNSNFIPDAKAISIESNWSDLSEQVQWSSVSGVFLTKIQLRDVSNEVLFITNVVVLLQQAALALMLFLSKPKQIRMPVAVAVGAGEQCPYGEPTTNIIGRDGQCVDVINNHYNNGDPIILSACGNAQRNQLWTFKSDGTIRSNGKCLTTYGYASGSYIMIFDCDIGTEPRQKWALYGDSTIRLHSNRTLCVTSDGHESLKSIILLKCQGSGDQRCTFMADGSILNPNAAGYGYPEE